MENIGSELHVDSLVKIMIDFLFWSCHYRNAAVRVGIILRCGKHRYNSTILLRVDDWTHQPILPTPLFFIAVPMSNQKSERSCICELEVSILPLFNDFPIEFWNRSLFWRCDILSFSFFPSIIYRRQDINNK